MGVSKGGAKPSDNDIQYATADTERGRSESYTATVEGVNDTERKKAHGPFFVVAVLRLRVRVRKLLRLLIYEHILTTICLSKYVGVQPHHELGGISV